MNFKSVIFGMVIAGATAVSIKIAYEYGRYSAVHEIYERGWAVVDTDSNEKQKDNSPDKDEES